MTVLEALADEIVNLLAPSLRVLVNGKERDSGSGAIPRLVHLIWSKLSPPLLTDNAARHTIEDLICDPRNGRIREAFRVQVKKVLKEHGDIGTAIREAMSWPNTAFSPGWSGLLRDPHGKDDRTLDRIEMISLLRSGHPPEEVAKQFGLDPAALFQLNASFSLCGIEGLVSDCGAGSWLDGLDSNDAILRRLDMIRLLRTGTPVSVIARQYDALEDYIERINEKFSRSGVLGILSEDDVARFLSFYPRTIRVCSYNLHGVQDGERLRFRRIAGELAEIEPHISALQEVVSGAGVEDTSRQIARWASSMTGYHYRSQFAYCHEFMEKYPEGVGLVSRCPISEPRTIDLTLLPDGLKPAMARNALVAEVDVFGRMVAVASVHLDHIEDPKVRRAQAEKLVSELQKGSRNLYCSILAGDFNDIEDSPAIEYLKSAGYRDAYRACHKDKGATFPAGSARERIDYIFVSGAAPIVSSGLLVNNPELSDHLGVFAEIG